MEPIPVVSGTCPPSTIEAIEPATFSRRVLACGGATLGGGCASGDVCVPPAVEGGVCVWQEGEHECPADFNERRVLYTGLTDTRSCQTCTCGTATGLCDGARIYFYSTDTCTPGTTDTSIGPTFGCQQNQSPTSAVRLTLGQPTAFCQPSTPSSVGDAAAEGPVTVCCTQ
jgi:hypothetical protein